MDHYACQATRARIDHYACQATEACIDHYVKPPRYNGITPPRYRVGWEPGEPPRRSAAGCVRKRPWLGSSGPGDRRPHASSAGLGLIRRGNGCLLYTSDAADDL